MFLVGNIVIVYLAAMKGHTLRSLRKNFNITAVCVHGLVRKYCWPIMRFVFGNRNRLDSGILRARSGQMIRESAFLHVSCWSPGENTIIGYKEGESGVKVPGIAG